MVCLVFITIIMVYKYGAFDSEPTHSNIRMPEKKVQKKKYDKHKQQQQQRHKINDWKKRTKKKELKKLASSFLPTISMANEYCHSTVQWLTLRKRY